MRKSPICSGFRGLADDAAVPVESRHAGEDGAGQEHLAGALAEDDGNLGLDVREQAGVVEVDVREQQCIGSGLALKQTGHGGQNAVGKEFGGRLAAEGPGIERLTRGGDQRQARVEDNARGGGGQFDARPTDFVGAAVDGEVHGCSPLGAGCPFATIVTSLLDSPAKPGRLDLGDHRILLY